MSTNLSKLLAAKQADAALSIEALAKAIGVSTVSLRGILAGKSRPNAATITKYASYLGLKADELAVGGKRGAKPSRAAKTAKAVAKAPRKPRIGLGAELVSAVSAAAAVLDDELALAVHKAGKLEREIIGRLLRRG